MFQDIKRICQSPTEEDKYWFPDIARFRLAGNAAFRDA
ncbi:hypothetical protein ACOI4E_11940 [Escherichia coli]